MKAYFIGGGIGSLAGAAFLIRDAQQAGRDIVIYEAQPLVGGSLDGALLANGAYSLRGGRMLTTDHYECTWDLLSSIPSLEHPGLSVRDETIAFNLETPRIRRRGLSTATASRSTSRIWAFPRATGLSCCV